MSNVLVTGGAGFIGSNLTEALLKQGHFVRVLDNFSTGKRENLIFDEAYSSLEIIEGDIRDLTVCQRVMKNIEYLFHQAALPSVQRSVEDPLDLQFSECGRDFKYSSCSQGCRSEEIDLCLILFHLWRYPNLAEA